EVGRRYLTKAGLPESAVIALAAGASTASSVASVARWFGAQDNRRVLLVSDGFHMLRLKILATRLGLVPFTSPAPGSPIRSNPRRNAAYFLAEGLKVPVTWLFNHRASPCSSTAGVSARAPGRGSTLRPRRSACARPVLWCRSA